MANPELGAKQLCPNCQAKFYDLTRRPAHCPKCDHEFDPDEAVRNRRVRARAAPVDHDAEEAEDQVRAKAEAEEEEEEDEVVTPELDEAVADVPLISDDDDEAPDAAPEDQLSEFTEDDDLEDEDDADVPFLEDEDEDDFDDTEIEGLPGEGDDDR
ncbi:TIGR02300 family protein [Phenylobacterium sp.]|uniref:TIGR02300 family protein n=1 Tax=Phenylobacterium sp. TaxID=1871053 RepID=UPI0027336F8A|nr:TIGR02300 family protein [Phenylobacterium sp.]MDP3853015.1 TIGR02300 family protein [Phenylobacterium sp.]